MPSLSMKSSWKNTGGSQIVPASSPSQQLQWFRCAVPRIRLRHDQIGRRCVVHSYFLEECDDGSCQRQTEVTVPRQSLKTCLVGGRCSVQSTRRERVAHRWQENTHPCAAWLQFVCVCVLYHRYSNLGSRLLSHGASFDTYSIVILFPMPRYFSNS